MPSALPSNYNPDFQHFSPPPSGTAPLEEGRYFGFLKDMDLATHIAKFDVAQLLGGDEADRAAIEDGYIQPGDHVPNDYYIRNASSYVRAVPFDNDSTVIITDILCLGGSGYRFGTLKDLVAAFERPGSNGECDPYRTSVDETGYMITVEGGRIIRFEKPYFP